MHRHHQQRPVAPSLYAPPVAFRTRWFPHGIRRTPVIDRQPHDIACRASLQRRRTSSDLSSQSLRWPLQTPRRLAPTNQIRPRLGPERAAHLDAAFAVRHHPHPAKTPHLQPRQRNLGRRVSIGPPRPVPQPPHRIRITRRGTARMCPQLHHANKRPRRRHAFHKPRPLPRWLGLRWD